ncbi:MAG: hypothetical protein KC421_26665 [Anaerolineales bacterium]|nr:hypothetical protein [Anaerolineales bacterium]
MAKKTIRTERRRRADEPTEGRKRAEAPQRRRPVSRPGTPRPGSGSGGSSRPPIRPPSGSVGPLLGLLGRLPLPVLIILGLIAVCLIGAFFIFGGGDLLSGTDFSQQAAPQQEDDFFTAADAVPTQPPATFIPPPPSTEGQTWLVMLYQDADDKILEQDIYLDLNEAERIGSNDRLHIVAQVDRYSAGYQGDGNWASTRRYYITQDSDLQRVSSQQIQDLGEVNMSDGDTLVDFVTWAIETFPADKHVLIMSDHGMGWPGGWSDPAPGGRGDASIPLASRLGDELYLMEIDEALQEIRAQTGLEQFELIGMDACLMGHLEVFSALQPHSRYAVASQEVEPALGWAYTGFLGELARNPDMTGADLGRFIVESYIDEDQRIVDDQARAEFLRQGSPVGGLFSLLGGGGGSTMSASQLARQLEQNVTLTAVDLAVLPALMDSVNNLSFTLQDADQRSVAQARSYAQSFTSVFGSDIPASYIDLGNFVQLLQRQSSSSAVSAATNNVLAAINQAVIAEKHGPNKPGATGVSIYFPNSQLYNNPITGPESYTAIARRFAQDSLWDDFMAFHYTGRTFSSADTSLVIPDRAAGIEVPGAGGITVSDLFMSDNVAAPGQPILLSVDITGENVGYIYLFAGFFDRASNSIYVADNDYLEAPDTREADGVFYPDWGTEPFTMEFEWEPLVFALNDGVNSIVAPLTPQSYGATYEEATYTTDGIYTYADGETRHARLLFQNGVLRQVFGFTNTDGTGAPREITPESGDTFTVLERWIDLDASGNVVQNTTQEGGTLTFSDQPITWEALDAAAGDYIVGFVVTDLDGNAYQAFGEVTVR